MSESRYAILPAAALDDADLTLTDLRVLGVIGYHSGRDKAAYPKQSTIATRLGIARETVNRSIRRLVAAGYVETTAQFRESGGQRESLYFVRLDPVQPLENHAVTPASHGGAASGCDEAGTQPAGGGVTRRSQRGVTPEITPGVTSSVTPGVTPAITPIEDPIGTSHENKLASQLALRDRVSKALGPRGSRITEENISSVCDEWLKLGATEDEILRVVAQQTTGGDRKPISSLRALTRHVEQAIRDRPPQGAERPPAPRPEFIRPEGRAGDCVDAIIGRFGMTAAEAWLAGADWVEDEVLLPSEYSRLQVDQRFGGVLRQHGFSAALSAS